MQTRPHGAGLCLRAARALALGCDLAHSRTQVATGVAGKGQSRMSPTFTPGPWHATNWSNHAATTVMTESGIVVAECSGHGRDADESIADASLIAAAPAMYEALKTITEAYRTQQLLAVELLAIADGALRKARGEQERQTA